MKLILCLCVTVLFAASVRAQQIGSVDLTHPKTNTRKSVRGCTRTSAGIIGDSFIRRDGKFRKLTLRMIKLSRTEITQGDNVDAIVRMQNAGGVAIEIPWSADPNTSWVGQDPRHLEWSDGDFQVDLVDSAGNGFGDGFGVKIASGDLYGSKVVPNSFLTIQPGEWVTARIRFKLAEKSIATGAAKIAIEWDRADMSWSVNRNCAAALGYVHYDHYYQQDHPSATITIRNR
jgi:hypothetical protein